MSLLPDADPLARPKKVPGWRQPWDPGRKLMVGGCVLLLGLTIAQGVTEFGLTRWVDAVVRVAGYVLLLVGFGLRMKLKREQRLAAREREAAP